MIQGLLNKYKDKAERAYVNHSKAEPGSLESEINAVLYKEYIDVVQQLMIANKYIVRHHPKPITTKK